MTAASQSNPEDIDTWTRAYAEEQARLSGVSVRDWIEQFVAQTAVGADPIAPEFDPEPTQKAWDVESAIEAQPEIADASDIPELEDAPDWVSRASAAFGMVEAQSWPEVESIPEPPEAPAETIAGPEVDEPNEFAQILDDLAAQVDAVRAQMTVKLREDSARRLDGIERALRGMREQIQAAEQGILPGRDSADESPVPPPPHFTGAAEVRALESQRMVELVDSGFERLEASSARQMAGLRADIEQLFGTLTARIYNLEQHAVPVTEMTAQPAMDATESNIEPELEPATIEPEARPVAAITTPSEPHADPLAFDSDLFDDFPEPPALTLRDLLSAAPASAPELEAASPAFDHEQDAFAARSGTDDDLVDSDDEWAAAGSTPLAWPDSPSAPPAPVFGTNTRDDPAETLPLTIRALEQSAGQDRDAATGAPKPSIFSLFGRGQSRLRKSA